MPSLRGKPGKNSSFMLIGGCILALGVIGVGIFLATRDNGQKSDSKEVVENKDKKHESVIPTFPETKTVAKSNTKEPSKKINGEKEKKEDPKPVKKGPPPKPDPPPPLEVAADFKEPKLFRGHDAIPRGVTVSPDGRMVLSVGDDKYFFSWSPTADKGSLRKNLNSPAIGAAVMPGGKEVLICDTGRIYRVDLATNNEVKTWVIPPNVGSYSAFAMSPDGKSMVTGMSIGKILWWDAQKNDYDTVMDAAEKDTAGLPVECIAIAPDGKTVIAGRQDGSLSVWDGPSGKLYKKWKAHLGGAAAVSISPDGRLIASGGVDNLIKIWDRQSFAPTQQPLKGHTGVVTGIVWSADSVMIVSAGIDKTIRAWDSVTGLPLRWSFTAGDKLWSLAIDPKDRFLVAGQGDAGVQLVFLPTVRPDYPPRSTWVETPQTPQPMPLPYQIEAATKSLREKYKADFALMAPEDQQALFEKLVERGRRAPDEPAARYALFNEARAVAVRIGRMEDAFKAIDVSSLWFEMDDLAERAAALKEAAKGTVSRPVVEAAANVVDQAEKQARPDIVDELLRQRELFPQLPDAPEVTARVQAAERRWTTAANDREAGKRLLAEWMKEPEKPETNLAYGKHLCFRLGQWTEGLPRLLKSDDAALKELAKKDQAAPKDGKGQINLAASWHEYANSADELSKPGALLRAKFWYDRASRAADLSSGDKISPNARAIEINRQVEALPNAPANKAGVPVKRQQFNSMRTPLALETQWAFAGTEGLGADGLAFKGEGTLVSRFRVLDACRVEFAFVPDGREVTVELNGESATFKPVATTAIVFVIAERKGPLVRFQLKSFTGMQLDEKSANLAAGKDDASAILFKIAASDKDSVVIKSITVHGMVRLVD